MSPVCAQVLKLLGLKDDPQVVAQIEKFIRCNGATGVVKAANAVARRRSSDPGEIKDPWAYCINAYNGSVARSAVLHPFLYVLENALRARVDSLMTAEQGRDWYLLPGTYLDPDSAGRFTKGDDFQAVQDRTGGGDGPYPIQRFRYGSTFLERTSFSGLQRIVEHNYASGPLSELLRGPEGEKLDPERVRKSLDLVHDIRNDVAHHRTITPEGFSAAERRIVELLVHLEFDVFRALTRIDEAADALLRETLNQIRDGD
jgi:hypothetical protein